MAESHDPLLHLMRGVEELLVAGGEALSLWRERESRPGAGPIAGLAELVRWLESEPEKMIPPLRQALRAEAWRWETRASTDPIARRLHILFEALHDALEPLGATERSVPAPARQAPRRAPHTRID